MDRLASLRVFREVVDSGSFAAAAARLDISAPMASKRIAQLERAVNARLLHRTSRRLSLTEAGSAYYEQCRLALNILDEADANIGRTAEGVRGELKVSAPVWFANAEFARMLAEHRRRFPEVLVDMHLTNRKVNLVADGFDVALRVTPDPSPELIARALCSIRFRLVAAATYLKRHERQRKRPGTVTQPVNYDAILPNYIDLHRLAAKLPRGMPPFVLNTVLRTDDTTLVYHAVHAGMGVAYLPECMVNDDLAAKRLVRVLKRDPYAPNIPMFAVYTSRKYLAPKVRTFIDFMSEALKGLSPADSGDAGGSDPA